MKKLLRNALVGVSLILASFTTAAPLVLVRDNFNAATANANDLNVNIARQTGFFAPVTYTMAFGPGNYGHQLQNVNAPNQLLLADLAQSTVSLDRNFNDASSSGGLRIALDLDSKPSVYDGGNDNWGCVNLGMSQANQLVNVNDAIPHFGILFRADGRIQAFDGSAVVSPTPEPVYTASPPGTTNHLELLLTDADGNPFDGSGNTVIAVFVNGGTTAVYTYTKVGGFTNNYINLQGSYRSHVDNFTIIQENPPAMDPVAIIGQPKSICVAEGLNATFTVQATGLPQPAYQWRRNGAVLTGATSATLTISPTTPGSAGNYTVVVTNSSGAVTSSVAQLTIGLPMSNPSFEADTFTNFPGYVSGNFPITGWASLGNHGINPGPTSPFADNGSINHGVKVAFLQGNGGLSQTVNGFVAGDAYYLEYRENARTGGTPSLEARIGGTTVVPAHLISPVGGANDYRRVRSGVFVAAAASLLVEFIKAQGAGADTTALIDNVCVVKIAPNTPPEITQQPRDAEALAGQSGSFSVTAIGSLPLGYQWWKSGAPIANATNATLTLNNVQNVDEAEYKVVVSNSSGSVTSSLARLTVLVPIPTLFNTGVNAARAPLPAGAVDPHYALAVNPDSASADALVHNEGFPIQAGAWLLNTSDSKWIAPRADTVVAAGGDYTYLTTFDLTDRVLSTVVIEGRWATDNLGLDILVNGISTGQLNNGQFPVWTPFTLTPTNSLFVEGVNTIEIVVNNADVGYTGLRVEFTRSDADIVPGVPPSIVTQPELVRGVDGDTATFSVIADGSLPLTYQWRKEGVTLMGQTNSTLTLSDLTIASSGNYSVMISNEAGTITSSNAALCVIFRPLPGIYGTGVDDGGLLLTNGQIDPHYILAAGSDSSYPGPDAYAVNEAWPIGPIGPWATNGPSSRWIAPRAEQDSTADPSFGNAEGFYTYQTTFDLSGIDPARFRLVGAWALDNGGMDILINGVSTGIFTLGFDSLVPFTITNGFVAGMNTVDFLTLNLAPSPNATGLRVDLRGLVSILPHVTIARVAGNLSVGWSPTNACQKLQSSGVVTGPWTDVLNPANPHVMAAPGSPIFFRVVNE